MKKGKRKIIAIITAYRQKRMKSGKMKLHVEILK